METPTPESSHFDAQFVRNMVESALRISLLFLLLYSSYDIIRPFTVPILWGAIIAMAAFPLVRWLEVRIGGRRGVAATLVTVFFILALVLPTWSVTSALIDGARQVVAAADAGDFDVPAPRERVADWPLIGKRVYDGWMEAHEDLKALLERSAPQIRELTTQGLKKFGASLLDVLMFIVSLIIAGGFMAFADGCGKAAHTFFVRVGGLKPGGDWAPLVVATVRSVLQGVVGVAVIQTALIALGLFAAGIPGAPILSVVILFLAIAQLPAMIVVLPIIIYAFSALDTTTAVIFAVWQVLAGLSDNVLKPLLMGRGLDIPMPVILIGAIGGMIAAGIIGLFAGAVILSIWYKLFGAWLAQESR
jgi:predicted PurR-regulated permease PerM